MVSTVGARKPGEKGGNEKGGGLHVNGQCLLSPKHQPVVIHTHQTE